jgi:hypothetical protein
VISNFNLSFARKIDFTLGQTANNKIVISSEASSFDALIANILASDIELATGFSPPIIKDLSKITSSTIVIGNINDKQISELYKNSTSSVNLEGKWEQFSISGIDKFSDKGSKPILIIGSDARGMAYGVFHFSELIGVSPWNWWADVHPIPRKELSVSIDEFTSKPPSVQYRGIFLNDEDWGLQPWAAKTLEPQTGDIGPATYEKIFELLLRLKANIIWPAMHSCTKAFFKNPENKAVAEKYQVYIGSSHAEPMLRNNVDEWDKKERGQYNYQINKENVYNYWEERVKEVKDINAVYTVGMRGIHDSGMEGFDDMNSKIDALNNIISDQRRLLESYYGKNLQEIPQVFIPYKEVLKIYDAGLQIPEDITLMWTDDNYGYIRRLPNMEERKRSGGNGIYYHISYWGRPHDYLWLSTTHPLHIWEEMSKAWYNDAKKIWIVNVGDIKPAEYNMELFLDMAYDIDKFSTPAEVWSHHEKWAESLIPKKGEEITNLFKSYYNLAWFRKPEFMGWSQVEYNTVVSDTEFSHFYNGDEAWKRINDYQLLRKEVDNLKTFVHPDNTDAFFQLVEYPVKCAGWMNEKFIFLEKANLYAKQQRASVNEYVQKAKFAYDSIVEYTSYYNNNLSKGKWKNMMDMAPRRLPVFELPMLPEWTIPSKSRAYFALEGFTDEAYSNRNIWFLPSISEDQDLTRFMDIYLKGIEDVEWELENKVPWIKISKTRGKLKDAPGNRETKVFVSIDWEKVPKYGKNTGVFAFKSGEKMSRIGIRAYKSPENLVQSKAKFIESRGIVSIQASNFSGINSDNYQIIEGWGYTGKVLALNKSFRFNERNEKTKVEYSFYTGHTGECTIKIFGIPVHPITKNDELRLSVSLDQNNPQEVNFRTHGRSKEWKKNVLSNTAYKEVKAILPEKGYHTLYLEGIDPGIIIDRIEICFNDEKSTYMPIPETKVPEHLNQ